MEMMVPIGKANSPMIGRIITHLFTHGFMVHNPQDTRKYRIPIISIIMPNPLIIPKPAAIKYIAPVIMLITPAMAYNIAKITMGIGCLVMYRKE